MKQVLSFIDQEEPDYAAAARLGNRALPHLAELTRQGDIGRASKAACLASHIGTSDAVRVVAIAARSDEAVVRVAAAVSLRNLGGIPVNLARRLLDDDNVGVRKWTLKALAVHRRIEQLRSRLQEIAVSDPDLSLRDLANEVLQKFRRKTRQKRKD